MAVAGGIPHAASDLPRRLSSFVGRERERAEVADALGATRLLTLTGVGGCGKTSLALEVARELPERFPGGVWWVELAPLTEPALVEPALARALGVRALPNETELDAAVRFLASRRALVVLDNCEHLLERCAEVAQRLLRECGEVVVIVTSRVPLGIEGEADWRVPSLSLPAVRDDLEAAGRSDAVRLFAERARLVQAGFSLERAPLMAVSDICRRLDGIPLAIELGAARLRVLSVEQIAGGLDDALALVAGGSRAALPRHRTLRASIDWSYELLDERERVLFRRLGVFLGGFTLETAKEVSAADAVPEPEVLDLLASLVEKSLVQADEQGTVVRYRLLETVRQYALERLEASGEVEVAAVRGRHRDVFVGLAERLAAVVFGPAQPRVLAELDLEAANVRAAFEHALATDGELALRLAVALALWWRARTRYQEAEDAYTRALATSGPEPSLLRARALSARAWVLSNSAAHRQAVAYGEQALGEAEAIGDQAAVTGALLAISNAQAFNDPRGAVQTALRARQLTLGTGDEWALARSEMLIGIAAAFLWDPELHRQYTDGLAARLERLGDLDTLANYWLYVGQLAYPAGDLAGVRDAEDRALTAAREIDQPTTQHAALAFLALADAASGRGQSALADLRALEAKALDSGSAAVGLVELCLATAEAASGELQASASRFEAVLDHAGAVFAALLWAGTALAELLRLQGDERAPGCAVRALELASSIDNRWQAARSKLVLGRLAAARGAWADAEQHHHGALEAIVQRSYRLELPGALEALAEVACGLQSHREAARILGAAERARHQLGLVAWPAQRAEVDALATRIRDAVGQDAFEQARSEGAYLTEEEAIAWLRRARGERKRPPSGWESLTPTELEVARHAADGLTNPQIAARMFISRTTVKTHLAHIYSKLRISNRAQLATEAERRLKPSRQPGATTNPRAASHPTDQPARPM